MEEAHVVGSSLVQMLSLAAKRKPSMGDLGSSFSAIACKRSRQRQRSTYRVVDVGPTSGSLISVSAAWNWVGRGGRSQVEL